jgi:biotin transport system substrate-specific component
MKHSAVALKRSPARLTAIGVVGFALALAVASQIAIPIPGTPVPFTFTPLVVVLAGLWLGPRAGAASMTLYLVLGATGLPVFAPMGPPGLARLVGPTAGYLYAYPLAAFVAGLGANRARTVAGRFLAALAGTAVILLGGFAWLAVLGGSLASAMAFGIHPFILLDAVKALLAAVIAPSRNPASSDRAPA